ncbi:hypothetical protein A4G20_05715 [Pasteurellaceae bacterium RH1A]|nr:hypothetical protein A4G20_05715 [Pasteurellaceae bacterium RH1A]
MANLNEQDKWENHIYRIEENDPVVGGENGITNKPTKQLANRTVWLKKALEALGLKAKPKKITATSTNSQDSLGHTHEIAKASTSEAGLVQLYSGTDSEDETKAATPKAVKTAHDLANSKYTAQDATTSRKGLTQLVDNLTTADTTKALTAKQGKALNDGKLGNSGNQTLSNGVLNLSRNTWEKLRATNNDGSFWRWETAPVSSGENGARFNFVFTGAGNTGELGRISFPRVAKGEIAAYQSWVTTALDAKDSLKTINYASNQSDNYARTGFYRANNLAMGAHRLPNMEIHITHPEANGNHYARGLGFTYGPNFGVLTTAWDKDGNYMGYKTVLTEDNGVMLAGSQTISGTKTFAGGVKVTHSSKSVSATFGMSTGDVYLHNPTSNKLLQLKDNGTLSYSNDKVLLYSDRSDAVNLDRTDKLATSKAVKLVNDNANTRVAKADISHLTNGTSKVKVSSEFALGNVAKNTLPIGSIVAFPSAIRNPSGFLKANGTSFNAQTYPDLYTALGNSNQLPDLTRSDVGQVAYFAVDNIPDGWIAFDDIATQVTQSTYPDLYAHLIAKYGAISAVPKMADRFVRNAGQGLVVGDTQKGTLVVSDSVDATTSLSLAIKNVLPTYKQTGDSLGADIVDVPADYPNAITVWVGGSVGRGDADRYSSNPGRDGHFAGVARPKAIALKAAIKAKPQFADVQFWIKAYGEVINTGQLDASKLAQDLHNKANLNHTHTVSDIADFGQGVADQFSYHKIGNFEVRKYPDGTMIQTYRFVPPNGYSTARHLADANFNWAVSFIETPKIFTQLMRSNPTELSSIDNFIMVNISKCTGSKVFFDAYEDHYDKGKFAVDFMAIGRWK